MADELEDKIEFLARRAFDTGAVKINLDEPFIGRGGKQLPINVKPGHLFENYDDRKLVADIMEGAIRKKNIYFEFVVGINTLSLIPGSVLAKRFGVPLVTLVDDNTVKFIDRKLSFQDNVDYVVGASRLSTPYATQIADKNQCKLTYLKPKKNEIDFLTANDPMPTVKDRVGMVVVEENHDLENGEGYLVRQRFDHDMQFHVDELRYPAEECLADFDLNRKRGLVIGTLLSNVEFFTGDFGLYKRSKSSFSGLHLFGYSLRGTDAEMKKGRCYNRSILHLDILLEAGFDNGYINRDELERMLAWRKNPSRWGARQGFPRVNSKTA
ncbi:MAG: hypothetical protein Q7R87_03355 [Nanoarchaeota archaeon]|nr:hypothetical protein [Nanoarchaeota archaeon]